ncbi:MAG: hypothetical protein KatS3mg131_1601 [Candidatus Tectimicrobiota bacterium]|nr:MAG: hypothetical protein KatS3mg131_1601 [Candidatus Tectomicrobia bacterium]
MVWRALAARRIPGRPPKLHPDQLQVLLSCLAQGPRAHGFASDRWTQAQVAELIRRKFGVTFCLYHVGRIMAANGWKKRRLVRHD